MGNSIKKNVKIGITLSALTMTSIYCINKFVTVTSSLKNLLPSDSGKFYEWRYGDIFYTKTGKGSPLLLIHDLSPESSSYEWTKLIHKLEKNNTVYVLDLLGCGRSDKPNLTYTNYMYVQLITDFIKNVITEKTDVVVTGNSASFVIMACNMNYEYFNKIILINPNDPHDYEHTPNKLKNAVKFLIDLPLIGTLVYNMEMLQKNIYCRFQSDYFYHSHLVPTKLIDTYYESAHLDNSHGKYLLSSIRSNYTTISITKALKNINNSIFIIESREHENASNIISSYTHLNSSIETAYIAHSLFLPQLEVPEKLNELLQIFIQSK